MIAILRTYRDGILDTVVAVGLALVPIALAFWWRSVEPEAMASVPIPDEPAGCPLASSFDGYTEHARALIGRDEGRKAYPRTVRIYTAPDGSWLIAYDPIGTGEYACIADQGGGFQVLVTGGAR